MPLDTPGGNPAAGGAVPEELAALVRAYTRRAALAPVMRIRTSRRALRLLDGAGQALAEIATDHVSAEPADGSATVSWDEIEAELVTGGRPLLEGDRHAAAPSRCPARRRRRETRPRALADRLPAAGPAPKPPLTGRSPQAR